MRNAETVLGVLRERGRRRWPLERIYRLLFNPELYLLAYGRIYSNKGAMTPGVTGETADGMSMEMTGTSMTTATRDYTRGPAQFHASVVVGAAAILRDVEVVDRGTEEKLSDIIDGLGPCVGDTIASPA